MKSVKLDEHQFKEYLSAEVIADKVAALGAKINND